METENPIFVENRTNPVNGKRVKSVWEHTTTKIGRPLRRMIWQYYRDRNKNSVKDLFKRYKGRQLEIIYSGDPVPEMYIP